MFTSLDVFKCSLVWMFSNAASIKKIENLQKRAPRILYKSHNTSYEDLLLKSGFWSLNVKRLSALCVEIFKTLNYLSSSFMKEIFPFRQTDRLVRENSKLNLTTPSCNILIFAPKYLTFFGTKTWNSLPIKSAENLVSLKTLIKFWTGDTCRCKICCKK